MKHIQARMFSATRVLRPFRGPTFLNPKSVPKSSYHFPSDINLHLQKSLDASNLALLKEDFESHQRQYSSQAGTDALAQAEADLDNPYQEVKKVEPETDPNVIHPQSMWEFNSHQWVPMKPVPVSNPNLFRNGAVPRPQKLHIVTWNVNAKEERPQARANALLNHILSLRDPWADVIFLQEVAPGVMRMIIEHPAIQEEWFLTDVDETNWCEQPHGTVALFRKTRFQQYPTQRGYPKTCSLVLGQVKRIRVQSRTQRSLLCCDIHPVPTPFGLKGNTDGSKCMRLINVHLDCLHHPWPVNHRPYQVAAAATAIAESGNFGVVAGDYNAIQGQDDGLLKGNGMVDAWVEKHSCEGGQTFGHWRRRDKVGLKGLEVERIEILEPGMIMKVDKSVGELEDAAVVAVPWSDHNGIRCTVGWTNGWDSL